MVIDLTLREEARSSSQGTSSIKSQQEYWQSPVKMPSWPECFALFCGLALTFNKEHFPVSSSSFIFSCFTLFHMQSATSDGLLLFEIMSVLGLWCGPVQLQLVAYIWLLAPIPEANRWSYSERAVSGSSWAFPEYLWEGRCIPALASQWHFQVFTSEMRWLGWPFKITFAKAHQAWLLCLKMVCVMTRQCSVHLLKRRISFELAFPMPYFAEVPFQRSRSFLTVVLTSLREMNLSSLGVLLRAQSRLD